MRISDWSSDVCSSDLLLALVLTATSAVNFAVGQPYTRYIYRALVHDVSEAAANVYLQERTFMEVKGVTFMAKRIWRDSHEFSGAYIYKEDEFGGGTKVTARRGALVVEPRGEGSVTRAAKRRGGKRRGGTCRTG